MGKLWVYSDIREKDLKMAKQSGLEKANKKRHPVQYKGEKVMELMMNECNKFQN